MSSEQHYHSTTVPPPRSMRRRPGGARHDPWRARLTCMRTLRAGRLAASHVSDRRTRPPLPSASWVSDARSALVPLARLAALVGLILVSASFALGGGMSARCRRAVDPSRRHHADLAGPVGDKFGRSGATRPQHPLADRGQGSPRPCGALHRARPVRPGEPRRVRGDARGPAHRPKRACSDHFLAAARSKAAKAWWTSTSEAPT